MFGDPLQPLVRDFRLVLLKGRVSNLRDRVQWNYELRRSIFILIAAPRVSSKKNAANDECNEIK